MKKILILLCACIVLVGCQSTPQKPPETIALESVYNIDKNLVSDSKTIAEVVSKAESISLAGCPANFVKAYQANISAWQEMANVERKMYASGNISKASSDIQRFLSDYEKNPTLATVRLKSEWPALANQIDSAMFDITKTFTKYTSIGAEYNAVFP